ncbi:short-chain dehydrogenase [Aeromicrobium sp. A1-2]|uniref:SDR family NAD(P)-dependent oxidoreductase n=1 Tax=Aeromicrobium sp. A1-2 TaxID=2107713 RepID=UPI000E4ADA89|nr:SDR family NAD(P)-dependent oxidoreductase [Aeromicrobium sp. A1-2]AXT84237.1 short-chain dehydrogenase [Aeromicrobium sp. A1-2]
MKEFAGRVAAITGAGSGIGRALALRLAREGCHVALSDRDSVRLAQTVALLEPFQVTVTSAVVDVADRDQMHAWATDTVSAHGQINLVFNNAGVAQSGSVQGNTYADYEWVLNINLWGVIHGTKAFLPHLVETGDGHIVNISSVFGLQAQPGVSAYNASKYAVRGFTESLRQELDVLNNGVSATCVHPGGIRTEIVRSSRISDGMEDLFGPEEARVRQVFDTLLLTSADRAAKTILTGVRHNSRRVLIGADARLLDLEQRLLPTGYQVANNVLCTSVGRALTLFPSVFKPMPTRVETTSSAQPDPSVRQPDKRRASPRQATPAHNGLG